MDLITDSPFSNGYNAVFTCVDRLTKMFRLNPFFLGGCLLGSREVAHHFFDLVIQYYGVPLSVVHDQDPQFTKILAGPLVSHGNQMTLKYQPSSTNRCPNKHYHHSIEQVLKSFILWTGNEWVWVKYLRFWEFALNSTVAASAGKAPSELVYSENVIIPLDHLTGATQFPNMQTAGEIAEKVSWLVDVVKKELEPT